MNNKYLDKLRVHVVLLFPLQRLLLLLGELPVRVDGDFTLKHLGLNDECEENLKTALNETFFNTFGQMDAT